MSRSTRAAGRLAGGLAFAVVVTISGPTIRLSAQLDSRSTATETRHPTLDLQLTSASAFDRSRIMASAQEALARYAEWLGPSPVDAITIVERSWQEATSGRPSSVGVDVAWRSAPATMDLESQVAYGVARQWWPGALATPEASHIVNGLCWYLQSRVVDRLFDLNFHVPGHSADGVRFFGGAVPWTFALLPLDRWTMGLGRIEFVRAGRSGAEWPRPARRFPKGLASSTLRAAMTFGTLERFVGWPALQGALRALAEQAARGAMTRLEIEEVIAAALGQDLSWFFASAFDTDIHFDYAIQAASTAPSSTCSRAPCHRTQVIVDRRGSGMFTGGARASESMFDAGDAMVVLVRFADGQSLRTSWDGRSAQRTFEFESDATAVAAHVDPDRVLLLDENYLNNAALIGPGSEVRPRKWIAYWLVWLQSAMLDSALLF